MKKARTAVAPRPATRPIFWAFLVLSVILKTSISSAAATVASSCDPATLLGVYGEPQQRNADGKDDEGKRQRHRCAE